MAQKNRVGRTPVKFFFTLALKNLARYRRRTIITASAIACGIAIFAAAASLLEGFVVESDRNFIDYELGSVRITGPGYWEERELLPLDILVEDASRHVALLEQEGYTAAARTEFRGDLVIYYDPFPEDGNMPVIFTGVDPGRDPEVFKLKESMEKGRFVNEGADEVIMGRQLADRIGADIGYPVTAITRTRDGFYQIIDLEIVGIFNTPNPFVNRQVLYIPLDTADYYLEMRDAVTSIMIKGNERIPGTMDIAPFEQMFRGEPLEVLSFSRMNQELAEVMDISESMMSMILMILAFIAVVGISNTMLMAVLERQKEIGMLRALGLRDKEVRWMFMFEASGIGIIGAAGGIILGSFLMWLLVRYGFDYGTVLDDIDMGYRFAGVLYGIWTFGTTLVAAAFAVILSGIVAIIPVRRMLKKSVTDCLRHS